MECAAGGPARRCAPAARLHEEADLRLRSRTLIIVFSETLRQAVTVGLAAVLVRLLDKSAYGTYRQVTDFSVFLCGLLSLSLPASLYYFVPELGPERRRALWTQTLILTAVAGGAGAVLMWTGAPLIALWYGNDALVAPVRVYSLQTFAYLALLLLPAFFISIDRALRSSAYSLLTALVRAAPVIGLAACGYPLTVVFGALVVTLSITAAVAVADVYRFCPPGRRQAGRSLLRDQLGYVLPLQAASLAGLLNRQFDRLMIGRFFAEERYGVYVNGAIELPLVGIITGSVAHAVMPNLVVLGSEGKPERVLALWHAATRKCGLAIYPVFALCLVCAQDLILFLYGPGYADAAWPFLIYLLDLPLRVAVYGALLRALGQTRPVAVAALLTLLVNVAVGLGLLYAGRGGLLSYVGPSVGVVVGNWIGVAYMLARICRLLNVPPSRVMRWGELAGIMGLCLLAGAVAALLPVGGLPVLARLLARTGVFAAALLAAFLATGALQRDERDLLTLPLRWLGRRAGKGGTQ